MAKKGALSMMPLDSESPEAQQYAGTMSKLAGALSFDDEDAKRDNWAAFGAGLTSPGDQAGALGRGMAAELAQRNSEKKLRAQYIPLVMSAVNEQAKQQQAAQQQATLAAVLQGGLANLSPSQVAIIKGMGLDVKDLYELDKFGKNVAAGSSNIMPNGDVNTAPDLKTGMYATNGVARPIANAAGISAHQDAMSEFGKNLGSSQFKETNVMGPGNTPGSVPLSSRLGVGTPQGPQPPQLSQFGVQEPQGAAQGPAPGQTPAPQQQMAPAAPQPAGPGAAITGQGVQPPNARGNPAVPPAVQGARNSEQLKVLEAEMPKLLLEREQAQRDLQDAMRGNDPQRLQAARETAQRSDMNIAGLSREIQQIGGQPPASLKPPVQAPQPVGPGPQQPQAPAGFVPTDMSTATKAGVQSTKDLNEDWIKNSYRKSIENANAAKEMNGSIASMREAVSRMPDDAFGRFGEFKKNYAEILAAMGVPNADKAATDYQTFQQAAQTQLWKVLNNASGPQTEGDAARARETFAKLGNTKRSNEFMMDFAQAANELAIKKADFYKEMRPIGVQRGDMSFIDNEWGQLNDGKGLSVWDAPIMKRWKGKQ